MDPTDREAILQQARELAARHTPGLMPMPLPMVQMAVVQNSDGQPGPIGQEEGVGLPREELLATPPRQMRTNEVIEIPVTPAAKKQKSTRPRGAAPPSQIYPRRRKVWDELRQEFVEPAAPASHNNEASGSGSWQAEWDAMQH